MRKTMTKNGTRFQMNDIKNDQSEKGQGSKISDNKAKHSIKKCLLQTLKIRKDIEVLRNTTGSLKKR